jgi:hypothetical protein
MDRAIPEFNRLVVEKANKHNLRMHKEKLRHMTPRVDNSEPVSVNFRPSKGKKEQMIEGKQKAFFLILQILERCNEIERSNHILLKKMEDILNGT